MFARHDQRPFGLLALAAALCGLAGGCGLQDYEKRLGEQQARLKYVEEENTYLEPKVVKLYEKKEKEKAKDKDPEKEDKDKELNFHPDSFFMRAPQGVTPVPDEKPLGILGRYPARGEGIKEMFVVVHKTDKRDEFKARVLKDLKVGGSPKTLPTDRLGYQQVFDYYQDEGAGRDTTRVYFNRGGSGFQVAVAFRFAGATPGTTAETRITYSLASVLTGREADKMHRQYKPTTTRKK